MVGVRPVEVAVDLAGVARSGSDAGEGRQGIWGVEVVQAATDGGEELGTKDGADARVAQDDVGEFVFANRPSMSLCISAIGPSPRVLDTVDTGS